MGVAKTLIVCLTVIASTLSQIEKVTVDVYYEALNSNSRIFITKQLYRNLQTNLSKYVQLKLIPYGKTKTTNENGQYVFKCDNGEAGCYANKIHACAINLIDNGQNNTLGLAINSTLPFIKCLTDTENVKNISLPNIDACASANKIANVKDIEKCGDGIQGSSFLAEFGKQTRSLQNPLRSVPTIVYNSVYSEDASNASITKFVKVLCEYIKNDKPKECSGNNLHISIGLMLLATTLRRFF